MPTGGPTEVVHGERPRQSKRKREHGSDRRDGSLSDDSEAAAERAEDGMPHASASWSSFTQSSVFTEEAKRPLHWPVNDYMIAALHYYYIYMI